MRSIYGSCLSVIEVWLDRIAVMHFGKIVEIGPAEEIYQNPLHDYTKSLLSAIPQPDPESERPANDLVIFMMKQIII